jgi:hypothetical protein
MYIWTTNWYEVKNILSVNDKAKLVAWPHSLRSEVNRFGIFIPNTLPQH